MWLQPSHLPLYVKTENGDNNEFSHQ